MNDLPILFHVDDDPAASRCLVESAAQISDHLGFVTPSQFSKFFIQRAGRTPIDFRNGVRGRAEDADTPSALGQKG